MVGWEGELGDVNIDPIQKSPNNRNIAPKHRMHNRRPSSQIATVNVKGGVLEEEVERRFKFAFDRNDQWREPIRIPDIDIAIG